VPVLQAPDGHVAGVCGSDDCLPNLPRRVRLDHSGDGAVGIRRVGYGNLNSVHFESACLPVRDATCREHGATVCSSS
jgi:hypothetical protein